MPIYLRKMLVEDLFEVVLFQEVKFEFGVYSDQYGYDNMELVFLTPWQHTDRLSSRRDFWYKKTSIFFFKKN